MLLKLIKSYTTFFRHENSPKTSKQKIYKFAKSKLLRLFIEIQVTKTS